MILNGKLKRVLGGLCAAGCLLSTGRAMEAAEPAIVNVKDFGAIGDGKRDDRPAFLQAIAEAGKLRQGNKGPVTIQVPTGTFRLEMPDGASTREKHLSLVKLTNVTLAGSAGTELVFGSAFHGGIGLNRTQNVTIRDLALDFDPLPFTQGTVVAVNSRKHYIDFELESGYPSPIAPHMLNTKKRKTKNVAYLYDPKTGRKLNQFYDQYVRTPVVDLGNNRYRLITDNEVKKAMVGTRLVYIGRRKAPAVSFDHAVNSTAEQITVYSAPSTGFQLISTDNITVDHCTIVPRPNSGRLFSTNADGLHAKWCRTGATVSNCDFSGMGDDSVNIGGTYQSILKRVDDHSLIVQAHGSLTEPGPEIVYMDRNTMGHISLGPLKRIKGTKLDGHKRPCMLLTFENELPDFITQQETGNRNTCHMIINLNACGRGAKVLNNYFHDHRVRGILMRAPNSMIKGNRFERLAGPAIIVGNDNGFLIEGPSPDNTVVEENLCVEVERTNIMAYASAKPQTEAATKGVIGLVIRNNRFEKLGGPNCYGRGTVGEALSLRNTEAVIVGNTIGSHVSPEYACPMMSLGINGRLEWHGNTVNGRPFDSGQDVAKK
jgi:hypothetical protein